MVVSHVCQLWRNTAIDVSSLWANVKVSQVMSLGDCKIARLYMERAKSCPLDVSYHLHGTDTMARIEALLTIKEDLVPNFQRVRQFTLIAEDESTLHDVMALFKEVSAPCLEKIRLSSLDPFGYTHEPEGTRIKSLPPLFACSAPRLHSIQLNGVSCFDQLNLNRLTSVSLFMTHAYALTDGRRFLRLLNEVSGTLTRLALSGLVFDEDQMEGVCVTLPALKSLYLRDVTLLMLSSSKTPHLEYLWLNELSDAVLFAFAAYSTSGELSSVISLRLDGLDLGTLEGGAPFFHGLPPLRELELLDCIDEIVFLIRLEPIIWMGKNNRKRGNRTKLSRRATIAVAAVGSTPESQIAHAGGSDPQARGVVLLPHLKCLTISEELTWPIVREILVHRINEGHTLDYLRCMQPERHFKIQKWLKKEVLVIGAWLMKKRGWNIWTRVE